MPFGVAFEHVRRAQSLRCLMCSPPALRAHVYRKSLCGSKRVESIYPAVGMIRLLYIYFICLLPYISTAWDASVSVTNGIHLVKENDSSLVLVQKLELNGSYRGPTRPLVHDPKRDFLYISGAIQKNATFIYRINLRTKQQDVLVINDSNIPGKMEGKILGMEHDYVKNILYWSNGNGGKILILDLNSNHLRQTLLHDANISYLSTSGLALDECSRMLFWTSYIVREGKGFIESSKLDGSSRMLLHHQDLHSPSDITVDHQAKKIYWCDIKAGLSYSIERSNFDGSSREPILKGSSGVEPISIANTAKYVYWINYNTGNVERVEKDPKKLQQDKIFDYVPNGPRSIVSRKIFQEVCEDIDFKAIQPGSADIQKPEDGQNNYLSHSSSYDVSDPSRTCLNGGYPERKGTSQTNENMKCNCPSKFYGQRCEKCEHCLNGRCSAGKDGSISCICDKGFSGLRCERNVCFNYCLNGGECSVGNHSEPICDCKNSDDSGNFHGPRCEINCQLFCQNNPRIIIVDSGKTLCSCNALALYDESLNNATSNKLVHDVEEFNPKLVFGLVGTGTGCFLFMISTAVLISTVFKLRKRPRIKKRIIVNKNITPTPLTSLPHPGEQCEITIENCCNMNICETPCYEPQLRASDVSVSKTEEKKNLLKNMEEGECMSPSQDNLY